MANIRKGSIRAEGLRRGLVALAKPAKWPSQNGDIDTDKLIITNAAAVDPDRSRVANATTTLVAQQVKTKRRKIIAGIGMKFAAKGMPCV